MRWEIHPKGSAVGYAGYAENILFDQAAFELWQKYCEDVAPANATVTWDHLRVEMWLDSGRVILFPTMSPFRHRIEKAVCQIICPDLLNFYETLIEADIPDNEFEVALSKKEQEVADLLSTAAKQMNLPARLSLQSVRVLYYGADLENLIWEDNFNIQQICSKN